MYLIVESTLTNVVEHSVPDRVRALLAGYLADIAAHGKHVVFVVLVVNRVANDSSTGALPIEQATLVG